MNEYVEPLGMRVLIRKDEGRQRTRGGIVLPDHAEIPTITGRVVEVSVQVQRDSDFPIEKYDKVLFHPKNSIPVDFEQNNLLYVVPIEDVVAVFRRHDAGAWGRYSPALRRHPAAFRGRILTPRRRGLTRDRYAGESGGCATAVRNPVC